MKIIYATDIHDALKELRILLSNTEADLYLLSGDILYKAFYVRFCFVRDPDKGNLIFVFILHLNQVRDTLAAGWAPSGPKFNHHHFALQTL